MEAKKMLMTIVSVNVIHVHEARGRNMDETLS